ncbi:MAG: glutathione synthase [Gammaproteobacteria bacterium]|nr:glutathione synthase [Gammaproteobacteria bacterium]
MSYKIGILMDPIESINPKKDSTLAMMLAANRRNWQVSVFSQSDVRVENSHILIKRRQVIPSDNHNKWFSVEREDEVNGDFFDAVLMRKDPPFNMEYIYATYLLEMIEANGTPVLNKPGSIRDCNEKLFALRFPECVPEHIVSKDQDKLREFHAKHGDVIYKPLDGMGGTSIFRAGKKEHNLAVIIETLTQNGRVQTMAQKYIPAIVDGDTRILLINGDPVPYGLARIPLAGETRGNLAAGGSGVGRELTDRDRFICEQLSPTLKEKGLYFVGIDVIGDYLTEINVTCPTCIRELDAAFNLDIASDFMQFIEDEIFSH